MGSGGVVTADLHFIARTILLQVEAVEHTAIPTGIDAGFRAQLIVLKSAAIRDELAVARVSPDQDAIVHFPGARRAPARRPPRQILAVEELNPVGRSVDVE